jgi:hypothetical protein
MRWVTGSTGWPSGTRHPPSSNSTTPLHRRLEPRSGWHGARARRLGRASRSRGRMVGAGRGCTWLPRNGCLRRCSGLRESSLRSGVGRYPVTTDPGTYVARSRSHSRSVSFLLGQPGRDLLVGRARRFGRCPAQPARPPSRVQLGPGDWRFPPRSAPALSHAPLKPRRERAEETSSRADTLSMVREAADDDSDSTYSATPAPTRTTSSTRS